MAPGAIHSLFAVDEDEGQLLQEAVGQLHGIEQISEDMQFERELRKESLLRSLPLQISSTKKNGRDRHSKDSEATPSKKKSKIDEDIVNGNKTEEEEHIVSPVSTASTNVNKASNTASNTNMVAEEACIPTTRKRMEAVVAAQNRRSEGTASNTASNNVNNGTATTTTKASNASNTASNVNNDTSTTTTTASNALNTASNVNNDINSN